MKYRLLLIFSVVSLSYLTFSCEYEREEEEMMEETPQDTTQVNDTTTTDTTGMDTTTTVVPHKTTYDNAVKAIVDASCAVPGCHAAGSSFGDFTTYDGLKIDADNGKIQNRVVTLKNMPPAGFSNEAHRDSIESWLNDGALEN